MNNFKSLLMFSTVLSFVVSVGFSGNLNAKTIWLEQDDFKTAAQGDGDYQPTNFTLTEEEVSLQTAAMKSATANTKKETVDDKKMPTLTAEGGFLLPTYVLPEAQSDVPPKTVVSVDDQNPWRRNSQSGQTAQRAADRSGVALKGIEEHRLTNPNSDKALLESIEKQYQNTTALLQSTAKRLEALENGIENLSKNASGGLSKKSDNDITVAKSAPRAPLLLPLAPIRSVATSEAPQENEDISENVQTPVKREYVDFILDAIDRSKSKPNSYSQSDEMILRSIPKEMKISFLPDSADLSGQAFKWLKVFAYNPQRTVGTAVEVRLSPENLDLQSRRFALIKGTLLANGLTPRQIRFVFTDREQDSVVLRNIQLPEDQEFLYQKEKNGKVSQQIIQKW